MLEGVPGTAKTLLAQCFAACLKLDFQRIQFTPDLMPGDVLGTNLFDFQTNRFTLTKGPIFTELLLADEINRTPPKTQAALLQAMQERTVTIDGTTHDLGSGFMVLATQNPIEQEGTYPLPEAQLDRFLFKAVIAYPERDQEREIVKRHGHGTAMPELAAFGLGAGRRPRDRRGSAGSRRGESRGRRDRRLRRGPRSGPPASDPASCAAPRPAPPRCCRRRPRALATLQGRDFVIPDDVKSLAVPTLAHRVVLSPSAEIEGLDQAAVIRQVIEEVEAPR